MPRIKLHFQILIALGLAVVVGLVANEETALFGVKLLDVCAFLGTMFLRALKMLVVPLIVSSIIAGLASIDETRSIGRLGAKTAAYYLLTTALAVLTGVLAVNITRPGIVDGRPAKDIIGLAADTADVASKVSGRSTKDIVDIFLRMIPENVFGDAAAGEMLGLITFALLFGYFMTKLPEPRGSVMRNFWVGVNDIMLLMTEWVMRFAPIGVFALVAKVVLGTGMGAFVPLALFFVTVVGGLAIHAFVTLPVILIVFGRVKPTRHFKALAPALLMAFSTASSSATLPLTMDRIEKSAGVSRRVTSFVLPLGATINMDGTALYECVAAMFIAQAYGIELGFGAQLIVVITALVTSIGVAGIPAASLVAIALILTAVGVPLEGIGLILAVDRVLDMMRTAVNVLSDACGAVVIARSEGEKDILASPA